MEDDKVACIITVKLRQKNDLTSLDRTRLARLLYEASALRLVYKSGETWVGLTYKKGHEVIATICAPCITSTPDNIRNIKRSYIEKAERCGYFGEEPGDVTLIDNEMPSHSKTMAKNWEDPVIFGKIMNSNLPAEELSSLEWFTMSTGDVKRNRKGEAYREEGSRVPNGFLLWDEDQYKTYACKKPTDPNKLSSTNTVAKELDIKVDVCSGDLPVVDCVSSSKSKRELVFEDVKELFLELLTKIVEVKTEEIDVWIDCVRIAASLHDTAILGEVCNSLTLVFGKDKRLQLGLDPASIEKKYENSGQDIFKDKLHIGFETLAEHLERISYSDYATWKNAWLNKSLDSIYLKREQAIVGVAMLATRYMRGSILFDESTARGIWYGYDDVRKKWCKKEPNAETLRELKGIITDKAAGIAKDPAHNQDLLTLLRNSAELVATNSNRTKLLKEMKDIIKISGFSSFIDKNYNIIPLANCCVEVLEFGDKRQVSIRPHKKQDYTTKVVPISYKSYSWDHPDVVWVMNFYRQFIPDEETLEFVLHWCGSCMWRGNRDRCILQLHGGGGNSKTAFVTTLEVLCDLVAKIKASAFYSYEKSAGSADTEFIALKDAAIGIIEEIEPGKTGRVAVAKNLSGGGKLPLRAIFQAEEKIDSTAKLLFVSNNLLHWPEDPAMVDRIHNVECVSRFSQSAPADPEDQKKENHYPDDPLFSSKLIERSSAIIWIFVEYLKSYLELGRLPKSTKVTEDTARYWREQNIYRIFVDSTFTRGDGHISQNEFLHSASTYFHRHPSGKEFNRERLMSYIQGELGFCDSKSEIKIGHDVSRGIIFGISRKLE
jgi:phage/plasmid-associated DNA primase